MKNISKEKLNRFYCLALAIIITGGMLISLKQIKISYAQKGVVKGVFTENIDDLEYEKIIEYGSSGIDNLEEMLKKLNITLYPEDKVSTFPDPSLGIGSRIEIVRANSVIVNDSGRIKVYRTWKKNVGDLINEIEIDLKDEDILSLSREETIKNDMEINITRVSMSETYEYENIDYKVINKNDSNMEKGLTKIEQYPEYGEKKLTYLIRVENGEQISKKLIDTKITKKPIDKIVLHGTKVVILGTGTATWYDWISGMTAAHNTLPMGSKVLVRASNGREVTVTIVDRGIQGGAIIDLSDEAFAKLAPLGAGRISVTLEKP